MQTFFKKIGQAYDARVTALARAGERAFQSKYGLWFLGAISFIESSLPLPFLTDPFLVAYVLAKRARTHAAIWVMTITSVTGGVAAYLAAAYVFELLITQFALVHPEELFAMAKHFETGTFLITLIGAVTPIPYTVVAVAAGSVQANLWVFIVASIIGRGTRYALIGIATYFIGPRALPLIQKHVRIMTLILLALFVCYVVYKLS